MLTIFSFISADENVRITCYCDKFEINQFYKLRLYKMLSNIHDVSQDSIVSLCSEIGKNELAVIDSLVCDSIIKNIELGCLNFIDYTEPNKMDKTYFTYRLKNDCYVLINYYFGSSIINVVGPSYDGRPYMFEVVYNRKSMNIIYFK